MLKKRNKKQDIILRYSKLLKIICILIFILLTVIYLIKGGFYSFLFDIKESKSVIIYSIVIIILLGTLIICNINDESPNQTERQKNISSFTTVGIIILILFFIVLLIFTLLDFFLPIIVLLVSMFLIYIVVNKLISVCITKYGSK